MIPGPGTGCAFVMCDQEEMRYTPEEYCRATVFPVVHELSDAHRREGFDGTNICELPILKDEKIVFCA